MTPIEPGSTHDEEGVGTPEADSPDGEGAGRKRKPMSRSRGEGTLYKSAGLWIAEVEYTDADGTHRKRRKRKTKSAAIEARRELINEIRAGTVVTGDSLKVTVREAMDRYLREAKARVIDRTYRDYERIARTQIVPALGAMRAHAIRRRDIVKFSESVNGDRSKQYAYMLAKAALGPYVRAVDPLEHPFPPRSAPRVKKRIVKPFDGDLCARVLAAVRGNELEAMYYLALATGARESELLGLRWADVARDHVTITSRLDEKTRELGDTKTDGSRRRVDIPVEIGDLLEAHRARNVARTFPVRPGDYVFLNRRGRPVGASNLRRTWRKLRVKHGLPPDYRIYDLRHTHASVLAAAGIASKVIAERLGHEGTRITDDTYSHLMPGMQIAATTLIGDVLRAARGDDTN